MGTNTKCHDGTPKFKGICGWSSFFQNSWWLHELALVKRVTRTIIAARSQNSDLQLESQLLSGGGPFFKYLGGMGESKELGYTIFLNNSWDLPPQKKDQTPLEAVLPCYPAMSCGCLVRIVDRGRCNLNTLRITQFEIRKIIHTKPYTSMTGGSINMFNI